jgi:hypothetical protein
LGHVSSISPHGLRLPVTDGDELVFGDRDSGHIAVLDQIRLAVSTGDSGNIDRADLAVEGMRYGLDFYNLLNILYAKWRDHHGSGAGDTDSTSGSVYSDHDFEMGVPHGDGANTHANTHKHTHTNTHKHTHMYVCVCAHVQQGK